MNDCAVVWDLTKMEGIEFITPVGVVITKEGFRQTLTNKWAEALGFFSGKVVGKLLKKKKEIRQRMGWWQYHPAVYDYYIWYLQLQGHLRNYKERIEKCFDVSL